MQNQKVTTTATEGRKSSKPVMEKKRRARINASLAELKSLLLDTIKKEGTKHSKMEKADILEMAVRHLKQLHQETDIAQDNSSILNKYTLGFHACAQEVGKYLATSTDEEIQLKTKLLHHLANCATSESYQKTQPSTTALPSSLFMEPSPSLSKGNLRLITTHRVPSTDPNTGFGEISSSNIPLVANCVSFSNNTNANPHLFTSQTSQLAFLNSAQAKPLGLSTRLQPSSSTKPISLSSSTIPSSVAASSSSISGCQPMPVTLDTVLTQPESSARTKKKVITQNPSHGYQQGGDKEHGNNIDSSKPHSLLDTSVPKALQSDSDNKVNSDSALHTNRFEKMASTSALEHVSKVPGNNTPALIHEQLNLIGKSAKNPQFPNRHPNTQYIVCQNIPQAQSNTVLRTQQDQFMHQQRQQQQQIPHQQQLGFSIDETTQTLQKSNQASGVGTGLPLLPVQTGSGEIALLMSTNVIANGSIPGYVIPILAPTSLNVATPTIIAPQICSQPLISLTEPPVGIQVQPQNLHLSQPQQMQPTSTLQGEFQQNVFLGASWQSQEKLSIVSENQQNGQSKAMVFDNLLSPSKNTLKIQDGLSRTDTVNANREISAGSCSSMDAAEDSKACPCVSPREPQYIDIGQIDVLQNSSAGQLSVSDGIPKCGNIERNQKLTSKSRDTDTSKSNGVSLNKETPSTNTEPNSPSQDGPSSIQTVLESGKELSIIAPEIHIDSSSCPESIIPNIPCNKQASEDLSLCHSSSHSTLRCLQNNPSYQFGKSQENEETASEMDCDSSTKDNEADISILDLSNKATKTDIISFQNMALQGLITDGQDQCTTLGSVRNEIEDNIRPVVHKGAFFRPW